MAVWLLHGAMGLSEVCDCGISGLYSLTIFANRDWVDHQACSLLQCIYSQVFSAIKSKFNFRDSISEVNSISEIQFQK